MNAFIDTSTLIKKYVTEPGAREFDELLEAIDEIIVAPIYWIEFHSACQRKLQEKILTLQNFFHLQREAEKDLRHFNRVQWGDALETKAVEMIKQHSLKTLDSIQLAAGILSQPDLFLTSDQILYKIASRELKHARLV